MQKDFAAQACRRGILPAGYESIATNHEASQRKPHESADSGPADALTYRRIHTNPIHTASKHTFNLALFHLARTPSLERHIDVDPNQSDSQPPSTQTEVPRGNAAGFKKYFSDDLISGFLVFLIALPLCLGISLASGFPPIAGIFTAIIGALVTTFISDSELTIKGPAAGMIVIVLGCVTAFGGDGMTGGWSDADVTAYKMTLAVLVVASVIQVLFGVFKGGILTEFFPVAAVHGMLAAIGVIIIAKQLPVALGVTANGGALELLQQVPTMIRNCNPEIAAIGLISIIAMFVWPMIGKKISLLRKIPSPVIVLLIAIPMGLAFDLTHEHHYEFQGQDYVVGESFLVSMPDRIFGMFQELTFPDFSALTHPVAYKWILMAFLIGSLESLLSAKAIDFIDPYKRKSSMDRDIIAVGVGNVAVAFVGGLPMISEIVRSRANIDNGAKTRFSDFWHGIFLLVCVAFIPMFIHRIPLAALAAMLIYTGSRLAHPSEFMNVWRTGREQLLIFVVTLVATLATDLLIGIAIGIATKLAIHVINGAPMSSMFRRSFETVSTDEHQIEIIARDSAVFSNWIPLRRQIETLGLMENKNVTIDFSQTKLVDHSVMDKLHGLESDFTQQGLTLTLVGLDHHKPLANHEHAARKRPREFADT
ncbi:Sulfate permease, MFS superfamily [Neorhodopirellula lusitana]|uniref:Sulfate permease, MFS superfamily n=1 Tax=Neorhodopirellula lusitana TaxID=445327 RepID=A0ABY1Q201_9BACT|nr:Sulfate permease, MFS superfamily [Neorhodopirellula lusitana]